MLWLDRLELRFHPVAELRIAPISDQFARQALRLTAQIVNCLEFLLTWFLGLILLKVFRLGPLKQNIDKILVYCIELFLRSREAVLDVKDVSLVRLRFQWHRRLSQLILVLAHYSVEVGLLLLDLGLCIRSHRLLDSVMLSVVDFCLTMLQAYFDRTHAWDSLGTWTLFGLWRCSSLLLVSQITIFTLFHRGTLWVSKDYTRCLCRNKIHLVRFSQWIW